MNERLEGQRRRCGPDCLSDFQLDCLLSKPGTNDDLKSRDHLRTHIEGCQVCAGKLDALQAGKERIARDLPLLRLSADAMTRVEKHQQSRPSFWSWPRLTAALSGAAITVALLLFVVMSGPGDQGGATRLKGNVGFGVYVKRGDAVFKGDNRGRYYPGDRLRFFHSNAQARYLAILNVESTGKVTAVVPLRTKQPVRVQAAREQLLSDSIELDESVGREQLLAVFCPATFDVGQLAKQWKDWSAKGKQPVQPEEIGLDPQCALLTFVLNKEPKPE